MRGWDAWKKKRGYDERQRVSRLFRYHVNTRYNPRGRIFRMICSYCKPNTQTSISQFHHVDYKKPFRGVWTCEECHRKIEREELKISPYMICDYTLLVAPRLRPATSAAMRAFRDQNKALAATPF